MAEARLRKLMAEVTVTPVYERMTVEEAGERLIKHLVTRGRKPSNTIGYQSYLHVHLGPFFGSKPIADITKGEIEGFVAACLEHDQSKGVSVQLWVSITRIAWLSGEPCGYGPRRGGGDL
jgi:hypothetical protein